DGWNEYICVSLKYYLINKKMMFYITILSIQELILYTFSRLFDEINHCHKGILNHHFERELATAPLYISQNSKIKSQISKL
ncbi:MAG: hypothetical protein NTW79_02750, partial [Candidatus Berkelbacteria bacterium]|nr:hypothetical protein [Candidatus Berkelbacteria bacterium]